MIRSGLHCIESPNLRSLIIKLKIIISVLSEPSPNQNRYDSVLRQSANSARSCVPTAVTIAAVTENMCLSWR
jgi:hypothetical protein